MSNKPARGRRAKTRHKISSKGHKVTVNKILQEIPLGSQVDIRIDVSMQAQGMPFRRYHGFTGTVTGKQGMAYVVSLYNGNQPVELVIGATHLVVSRGGKQAASGKQAPAIEVKA